MTDTNDPAPGEEPPAAGWWKASDGNWYPPAPQQAPPPPPPPSAPPPSPGPPGEPGQPPAGPVPSNGAAVAALVLGIVSLLLFWAFGVGALLGIVAVVVGVKGTRTAAKHPARPGNGLAVGGIVTGAIGIVAGLVIGGLVLAVALFGEAAEDELERIEDELEADFEEGDLGGDTRIPEFDEEMGEINSDPVDGSCDMDRYWQDPDC